jgi:hypothetical protein
MTASKLQEIIATVRPNPNDWSFYENKIRDGAKKIFNETVLIKEPDFYPFAYATQIVDRGVGFSFMCNKSTNGRFPLYECFLVFVYQTYEGENVLVKIQKVEYNYDSE